MTKPMESNGTNEETSEEQFELDPTEALFFPPDQQSQSQHMIFNDTRSRVAFKVKCSAPDLFRFRPVCEFIDRQDVSALTIVRLDTSRNQETAVIEYTAVKQEENDPRAPFADAAATVQKVELALTPVDKQVCGTYVNPHLTSEELKNFETPEKA